ncbi:winged helix-turn-helix transcriptional regulator [Autumnicola musiva]|uniref:Helix-turn-helix domain-containing protein n=1 Tax=Autumnicola musiva TaxID=3075589 RepID=A0ABU3D8U2_9FLAO|nr:helix-turn-helix domain-containing protein [Zunongwangia sp. F117]MDT0677948.1 helix-turn-helix domain-containing protein [Zunongwangia sp. F117]
MKKTKKKSNCPINSALEVFGDKWTFLIVRDIMFNGKHYYGEFLNAEEKISTNILADRLSLLEQSGIITKTKDNNHKSKFVYRLTQKGIDLLPILLEFIVWSSKYDKDVDEDNTFFESIRKDKIKMLDEISNKLKNELIEH